MYNTNLASARAMLCDLINMAIDDSEVINISTNKGDVVIISEANYKSLLETLKLNSDPEYKQSLIDGMNTPVSECIPEDEVGSHHG